MPDPALRTRGLCWGLQELLAPRSSQRVGVEVVESRSLLHWNDPEPGSSAEAAEAVVGTIALTGAVVGLAAGSAAEPFAVPVPAELVVAGAASAGPDVEHVVAPAGLAAEAPERRGLPRTVPLRSDHRQIRH